MILSSPIVAEQLRLVADKIVPVNVSSDGYRTQYDVIIGKNLLASAGELIAQRLGYRRCIIVTGPHIAPHYASRLDAVLSAGGHTVLGTEILPAGEGSKNLSTLHALIEKIMARGVDRQTLIIALGGGVTGDLAGLSAALVLRGLDFVQIPTSLLAQIDSAIGGKLSIDTSWGKNTLGTYHQPKLVIVDVTLLDSLPMREMRAGYAEIVKYGLIADVDFFNWCQSHGAHLLAGSPEAQIHAIKHSCSVKAEIVARDERETTDLRRLLNLGHTFGHALEQATNYNGLLIHGEAVAVGSLMAFCLSARMGLCSTQNYATVRGHFAALGLPVLPPKFSYNIDELIQAMRLNKQTPEDRIELVLPMRIGQAFVCRDVKISDVRALWEDFLPAP